MPSSPGLFGAFFCLPAFQGPHHGRRPADGPRDQTVQHQAGRRQNEEQRQGMKRQRADLQQIAEQIRRHAEQRHHVPNSAARSLLRGMQTRSSRYSQINAVR